jgi:hypothetical protein
VCDEAAGCRRPHRLAGASALGGGPAGASALGGGWCGGNRSPTERAA